MPYTRTLFTLVRRGNCQCGVAAWAYGARRGRQLPGVRGATWATFGSSAGHARADTWAHERAPWARLGSVLFPTPAGPRRPIRQIGYLSTDSWCRITFWCGLPRAAMVAGGKR